MDVGRQLLGGGHERVEHDRELGVEPLGDGTSLGRSDEELESKDIVCKCDLSKHLKLRLS